MRRVTGSDNEHRLYPWACRVLPSVPLLQSPLDDVSTASAASPGPARGPRRIPANGRTGRGGEGRAPAGGPLRARSTASPRRGAGGFRVRPRGGREPHAGVAPSRSLGSVGSVFPRPGRSGPEGRSASTGGLAHRLRGAGSGPRPFARPAGRVRRGGRLVPPERGLNRSRVRSEAVPARVLPRRR